MIYKQLFETSYEKAPSLLFLALIFVLGSAATAITQAKPDSNALVYSGRQQLQPLWRYRHNAWRAGQAEQIAG